MANNKNVPNSENSKVKVEPRTLHESRVINIYSEMQEGLAMLKKAGLFQEYLGYEMAVNVYFCRYKKILSNIKSNINNGDKS
jgi:hypothetical protein